MKKKKKDIRTGLGKAVKQPEILDIEFCTLEVLGMMCFLFSFNVMCLLYLTYSSAKVSELLGIVSPSTRDLLSYVEESIKPSASQFGRM